MATIIDKIKASVESATGLPFYYDTPETINTRLDSAAYPCAFLYVVESGTLEDENGVIRERVTVNVLFSNTTQLDFDGVENEAILDGLKISALKWLVSLHRSSALRLVQNSGTQRLYATNDAILTAYAVTVTLEEIDGVSACDGVAPSDYDKLFAQYTALLAKYNQLAEEVAPLQKENEELKEALADANATIAQQAQDIADLTATAEDLRTQLSTLQTAYDNLQTAYSTLQATYDAYVAEVNEGKAALAVAITDKGVQTESTDSLQTMAENVESIDAFPIIYGVYSVGVTESYSGKVDLSAIGGSTLAQIYLRNVSSAQFTELDASKVTAASSFLNFSSWMLNQTKVQVVKFPDLPGVGVNLYNTFWACASLREIEIKTIDTNGVSMVDFAGYCRAFTTIRVRKGGEGFKNIKVVGNNSFRWSPFTRDSALVVINGLYDFAAEGDTSTHTLTLSSTTKGYLTADDIAIATNKGWTIA